MKIASNVVTKDKLREVNKETLKLLREALIPSFGPMGSNTKIYKDNMLTKYTKDGHTILSNIQFLNAIEQSVKDDLTDLTRNIVKEVGDGTTSAIILSSLIFESLIKIEEDTKLTPYQIIDEFKKCVAKIKEEIKLNAREATVEDMYNICMIATNGNEEVSKIIRNIYDEYGMDVFIDVGTSTTSESYIKSYDGMSLEAGYSDTAYINDTKRGVASVPNPRIYAFEDPIDTPEMMQFFDKIINTNIIDGYTTGDIAKIIPTVIMMPKMSRDMGSYMEKFIDFLYKFPEDQKPPILIIANIFQQDEYLDITRLCGCKMIRKYIDPELQKQDVELGLAPTIDTVIDFYGKADLVESDIAKSKFINPAAMHDENGELSETYNNLLAFLEAELKKAYEEGENNNTTGQLKRRINSLKANLVEYLIGGISMSDRDSLRDLVEDAVLNCRSAAREGVGYAANFEGLRVVDSYRDDDNEKIINAIYDAYVELTKILYNFKSIEEAEMAIVEMRFKGMPKNIITGEYDGKVLSSINSDIVILDTISKIISIMFTCNQFLCQSPIHNKYVQID